MMPADTHVHTEWSWDAPFGSMLQTCLRAVELGLPAVAFTEHADLTSWVRLDPTGAVKESIVPGWFDVDGYLVALEDCRERFPELTIRSGVELSEPHWHADGVAALLDGDRFAVVLGSVHSRRTPAGCVDAAADAYIVAEPAEVVRGYLADVREMVIAGGPFDVVTHIDYALRGWPAKIPYDIKDFAEEFRDVLELIADSGRLLEINTKRIVHPELISWWYAAGGEGVTFGSDAHQPELLARQFAVVAQLAEQAGFRPGRQPFEPWCRGLSFVNA